MIEYREEMNSVNAYDTSESEDLIRENIEIIKLDANENALGTSPKVLEALKNRLSKGLNIYPDGSATDLKKALAEKFDIKKENILITNGGDDGIAIIGQVFVQPEDEIIVSENSFVRYTDSSIIMGGKMINVPMKNYVTDLDGFLKSITDRTKIIWFCNPNNPTGSMVEKTKVYEFLDSVPEDILVVYDDAYGEFVEKEWKVDDSATLFKKYKNVITLKTFSKVYGLAGLRVGYLIGDEKLMNLINRGRQPFNSNVLGQVAALAALEDEEFVKKVYETNISEKHKLYKFFEELDIEFIESQTNHIFFKIPNISSTDLYDHLRKKKIFIRPQRENYSRVSIGTPKENEIFIKAIKEII